ncbi:MAG: hypothetical protein IJE91_01695 [Clostridia bacterium]|nr:hypothetical protein [Clostridia bacterium]
MKLIKMFNKSFTIMAIVIAVVSLLLTAFLNTQSVFAQAEGGAVEHEHHHEEVVAVAADSNVEVGEFENSVTLPPVKCDSCGCEVYECPKCYKEDENGNWVQNCPKEAITDEKEKAAYVCPMNITEQTWYKSLMQIVGIVDSLLNPLLIIGGTAGMIFVIILGVNFSKAESADKREEAKKRMINAIIGVVVTLLLLILVKLFTANADEIVTWINTTGRG